jgi:hypothetical protein
MKHRKYVVLLAVLGLSCGVMVGLSAQNREPLIFRDNAGQERIFIGMEKDVPRMRMRDSKGKARLVFGVNDGQTFAQMLSAAGKVKLDVLESEDGSQISMHDSLGKVKFRVSAGEDSSVLIVFDKNGKVVAEMLLDDVKLDTRIYSRDEAKAPSLKMTTPMVGPDENKVPK